MRRDFKSVLKPSAQMFQLCEPAKHFESTLTSGLTKIYQSLSLPMEIKACTYLLDVYGLRITEVLNITNHDIDLHGRIKIKGLKGSSNRIITGGHYEAYFINCKNKNIHPFTIYDRFFYYRLFKKMGIFISFCNYAKRAVTHACRHQFIAEMQQSGSDILDAQKYIGHKSVKSTEHYVKKCSSRKN